jgi:selenocysteine lyase/cysteine desulfurase
MEHHSNDLPHRQHAPRVIHLPVDETSDWKVDLENLRKMLALHIGHVNYIAVTAASNVTGLLNPIPDITRLAHAYGAKVLVDGAQIYAHHPISLASIDEEGVDFFVFSGHKAHAPYAPGVLVARKNLLAKMPPLFFGGGMVSEVSKFDFSVASGNAQKEHAGTPSILGAFSLGLATDWLAHEGIAQIAREEQCLKLRFINQAATNESIRLYGNPTADDGSLGIVCFNLSGIPHNLLGAMLNDYFCIAVRTGCFCAHPYVRQLLFDDFLLLSDDADTENHKGMVRISLGPHNTVADIDLLLLALKEISANFQAMAKPYKLMLDGAFRYAGSANSGREHFEVFMRDMILTPDCCVGM